MYLLLLILRLVFPEFLGSNVIIWEAVPDRLKHSPSTPYSIKREDKVQLETRSVLEYVTFLLSQLLSLILVF